MLTLLSGAVASAIVTVNTRRETERDRAFLREQQRMHAMMAMQTGAFDAQFGYQLGTIPSSVASSIKTWYNDPNDVDKPPRPVPTPCVGCGATKLEKHVHGWRCAYCGRDR